MDKSVPHIGVLMETHKPGVYPRFELPEGYRFADDFSDLPSMWCRVQLAAGHIDDARKGEDVFRAEFGAQPDEWPRRFALVLDECGKPVGTAAVWTGEHFGRTLQRVHWVGVDRAHGGRGIAKAMMTRVLDLYNAMGYRDYMYLTSQTWSYDALHIYMKFGFEPYRGGKPVNWRCEGDFCEETERAWRIIMQKIDRYRGAC